MLRRIGLSVSLAATGENLLPAQDAAHVHNAVAQAKTAGKGVYKPKALTAHEYATLQRLSDLIIPGALQTGAADYIDFLCSINDDLKEIYTGGLLWIDNAIRHQHSADFISATAEQQTALLDKIAYRKNASPELNPGIKFFSWVRNMVVDAYYTTPTGVKEIGYIGNGALAEFSVPKEALEYALKRSPLA